MKQRKNAHDLRIVRADESLFRVVIESEAWTTVVHLNRNSDWALGSHFSLK